MKDRPLVSVCCITYNHEKYIRESIEGFLSQKTDFDYEIIIGEDCSTDYTRGILDEYAGLSEKIQIISSENNVGMNANLIRTIKAASGKYIAICEGDDYWTDVGKLQKQADFMEMNSEYSFCGHTVKVLDNRTGLFSEEDWKFNHNYSGEININQITKEPLCHIASCFFRSNVFEQGIPDYIHQAPIMDYFLQLIASEKGKIYYLNEEMAVYRRYAEKSWSDKINKKKLLDILEKHVPILEKFKNTTDKNKKRLSEIIEEYMEEINYIKEVDPEFNYPEYYLNLDEIDQLRKYEVIYIFGAGGRGVSLKKHLEENNIKIKGFIDNNKSDFYGEKVFSLDMIDKKSLIVIASDWYKDIIQQLKEEKFINFYVFWL
ncbi:glycosyltransferase family 2 protein [Lysinibacillus piscis]|uniref:Glycosyltransferase 2-like domain-containing protein n=1 Tax=Lysinibacillus piscis TaxID=2518931 RepID=A0ABQ5NIF1_9BACI|nr:glycosyltransferase family 2 protein [Lysinibacillus sp. KH24]GLC87814.1 hypothetical protein LYSBPC_09410 [Lysinibacillus sp. KH24]